jgi:hypothetical protein
MADRIGDITDPGRIDSSDISLNTDQIGEAIETGPNANTFMQAVTPSEGLTFGEINGGAGAAFVQRGESVSGNLTQEWQVRAGGNLSFEGAEAFASAEYHQETDLGNGHSWSMGAYAEASTIEGVTGQAAIERSWENPDIGSGEYDFESWRIGAGALGSSDGIVGAVSGEVTYGGDMGSLFARGAAATDGRYGAEFGVSRGLGDIIPGQVGDLVGDKIDLEAGYRAGNAGDLGGASLTGSGSGAFVGFRATLDF